MVAVNPFKEATDMFLEAGGEALQACYQCGTCTAVCPWNLVTDFLVREIIHTGQIGLLTEVADEKNWLCATCGACEERCPRGVKIIDIWRAIRRVGVQVDTIPRALKPIMSGLESQGNPWGDTRENRTVWTKGLDLKPFEKDTEFLYCPCCTPIYDNKARRIAVDTVDLLKKAGIDFGILGPEESCCGESVRKLGNEELFLKLAESNIETFKEKGVRKIIVSSPHCFHTFKNEYAELGANIEVLHATQFFLKLIEEGKLKPEKGYPKKVAYHDPCYLGRHNKIYDEPRKLLTSIPELELVELADSREDAICCGGGGGRIWMETVKEERLSNLRVDQALDVGAKVLALTCPYCMLNFDDSVLNMGKSDLLEVKDITEILNSVVGEIS
jgi:Fe-S oxidoreductase